MSKKRSASQIAGDLAVDKLRKKLPIEWVIRTLTPDYGMDLLVELFDFIDDSEKICETLGEFIYVQVKGSEKLNRKKIKIYPVYNVAKSKWNEDKKEFIELDVINFSVDVSLLETVKRVGSSVCVLLFIVDILNDELFFICLNDIIDKYIQPRNPTFTEQNTITIPIPIQNQIDGTYNSLIPIRLYGKRSKLYSAFALIRYQHKELRNEISMPETAFLSETSTKDDLLGFLTKQLSENILFFSNQLLQLDIWNIGNHFFALQICKLGLDKLVIGLTGEKSPDYHSIITQSLNVWEQLDNLSSMYEEISREWFLPKFIGQLGSDANAPEIVVK